MAVAESDEERVLHGNGRRTAMTALAAMIAMTMISASGGLAPKALAASRNRVNLSPKGWPAREYARFMEAQGIDRTAACLFGTRGAFTLAYGGLRSEEHTSELQS